MAEEEAIGVGAMAHTLVVVEAVEVLEALVLLVRRWVEKAVCLVLARYKIVADKELMVVLHQVLAVNPSVVAAEAVGIIVVVLVTVVHRYMVGAVVEAAKALRTDLR
jgi:hypothetical protein